MQQSDVQNCCSICFEILDSSKGILITEKIMELLTSLIANINIILQNTIMCEVCLENIQSACKFKSSYSKNAHKMDVELEDELVHSQNVCKLCKNITSQNGYFPIFGSLIEIRKLDLINYLSSDLELTSGNYNMCEQCYKSMLNFCSITNLLCIFDQDKIDTNNAEHILNNRNTKGQFSQAESQSTYINLIEINSIVIIEKKNATHTLNDGNEDYIVNEQLKMDNEEATTVEFDAPVTDLPGEILQHSLFGSLWDSQQMSDSSTTKIFKCDFCEYQTQLKRNLKGHMLTHRNPEEITMFKCPYCEHQSKRKGNLIDHMLIHKSPNEIKMFKCSECSYQSKYRKGLKRHMITHMNSSDIAMFECENCQFRTRNKSYMLKHVLIHQKIQLFKCAKCDFQTKQNRYLLSHMLVHKEPSEVKMYKCQNCEYQTKRRSDLRRHNLRVHKNII